MMKLLKWEKYLLVITVLFIHSFFLCVNGKHFVLIHGAQHGAWCWYKVANQLKSFGHNVTTLDMAASGINPKHVQEVNSIAEYHEPLMTFMASLPPKEKVIIVGHSLGGVSVSVAMEKFPHKISVAIFVTATVVSQNLTFPAFLQEAARRLGPVSNVSYFRIDGLNKPPVLTALGVEVLTSTFYQLSPTQDLTLALSLVRPLPSFTSDIELLKKQTAVTNSINGKVSKVYIISGKDKVLIPDFQRWTIDRTGPYAEVKVIDDSDHMVMFSKPEKLSYELLNIAHKY